jgi:parallel beta helix pectate lyase-like protein
MSRIRCLVLLCAISAMFSALGLMAAQRTFVSAGSGSDSNPCSRLSPCRNFAAALLQTDASGEIVVLDSGGYGPVTITQSVSIIAPTGAYAGITAFTNSAVTVNAGDGGHVVLRNIVISSQGADTGIWTNSAAAVYVDDCVITGFATYGIYYVPTSPDSRLYVSHSVIRRNTNGVYAIGGVASVRLTLESVRLLGNDAGLIIQSADATIRKSVISGSANNGVLAESGTRVAVEDSVSANNAYGFFAFNGGVITVARSAATSNSVIGISASLAGSTVYVSDSTIAANGFGISVDSGGVVTSRGNNTLQANATDGSFTSTFGSN